MLLVVLISCAVVVTHIGVSLWRRVCFPSMGLCAQGLIQKWDTSDFNLFNDRRQDLERSVTLTEHLPTADFELLIFVFHRWATPQVPDAHQVEYVRQVRHRGHNGIQSDRSSERAHG